jgi:hypothetical protein
MNESTSSPGPGLTLVPAGSVEVVDVELVAIDDRQLRPLHFEVELDRSWVLVTSDRDGEVGVWPRNVYRETEALAGGSWDGHTLELTDNATLSEHEVETIQDAMRKAVRS